MNETDKYLLQERTIWGETKSILLEISPKPKLTKTDGESKVEFFVSDSFKNELIQILSELNFTDIHEVVTDGVSYTLEYYSQNVKTKHLECRNPKSKVFSELINIKKENFIKTLFKKLKGTA